MEWQDEKKIWETYYSACFHIAAIKVVKPYKIRRVHCQPQFFCILHPSTKLCFMSVLCTPLLNPHTHFFSLHKQNTMLTFFFLRFKNVLTPFSLSLSVWLLLSIISSFIMIRSIKEMLVILFSLFAKSLLSLPIREKPHFIQHPYILHTHNLLLAFWFGWLLRVNSIERKIKCTILFVGTTNKPPQYPHHHHRLI